VVLLDLLVNLASQGLLDLLAPLDLRVKEDQVDPLELVVDLVLQVPLEGQDLLDLLDLKEKGASVVE
jgi:hypothetical protein